MAEKKPGEAKKRALVKGRHRGAIKRQRQSLKRAERNQASRSAIRTAMKRVSSSVDKKDRPLAEQALSTVTSLLAKAASRGFIHSRHASRHISRLASLVQTLS